MRKITEFIAFDENTFEELRDIVMLEDGVMTLLGSVKRQTTKYTPDQILKINRFNKALIDNDLPMMSEEEAEWAVRMYLISKDVNTTEELQRLAGYKVEKKITYLDKNSNGVEE